MAGDIAKHLLRTLAAADVVLSEGALKSLLASYQRRAEDAVNSFYALAKMNGLTFLRHEEETAVATFARALKAGAEQFQQDPLGAPQIPNWARVLSAVPDAGDLLLESVHDERRNPRALSLPSDVPDAGVLGLCPELLFQVAAREVAGSEAESEGEGERKRAPDD